MENTPKEQAMIGAPWQGYPMGYTQGHGQPRVRDLTCWYNSALERAKGPPGFSLWQVMTGCCHI
eukprot:4801089-Karenia_brevis.AAC.1